MAATQRPQTATACKNCTVYWHSSMISLKRLQLRSFSYAHHPLAPTFFNNCMNFLLNTLPHYCDVPYRCKGRVILR